MRYVPRTQNYFCEGKADRGDCRRVDLIHISFELLELHWLICWLR
jgi:hypothetical protein